MADRRALLRALAAAGVLGPAGISGLIREALAAGLDPVAPGLYRIRGTVTVNGQPAREGQLLRAGDTIATGPKSEAIYVIGQDAFMQREKSAVSFAGDAAANVMRVITGGILSVFGKGEKKLIVPTATIGIRGTGCYIEANEKSVYFCLCYGLAEVVPTAEPGRLERVETEHHDRPMLINNDPGMPTMWSAPVINHNDDELVLLENLVGRWPPFYGKTGLDYYGYGKGQRY
ncbi:MAG: hypothetical protein HYU78_09190 [Rhodocyclales bacterium]|nr:hypothetical protein [Rhodocyclales bacterium]